MSVLVKIAAEELRPGERVWLHDGLRTVQWVYRDIADENLVHVSTVAMGAEIVDERFRFATVEVVR